MAARPPASLIYNPNAGRRRHGLAIEAIKATLNERWDLSLHPTSGPMEAISLARDAASRGDVGAFAWGGDGTLREVTEGLLGSPTFLGVLPGGTFNVVALALGLPRRHPIAAARALVGGEAAPRDVGVVGSMPFLMQATAGLDGFLMHHLRADLKARLGMAGTYVDAARALARYKFPRFHVEVDGVSHEVTGAAFVNMAEYAGPYEIAPGARWDDGKAHVLLYRGRTRFSAILFAIALGLGRHHRRHDVTIKEARELTIHPGPEIFLQADGDPWRGELPTVCRLAAEQIQVLIPRPGR